MHHHRFYYVLAFLSGAAVLTVEIASTRLLTPYFGASVFVWTSAISVVLGALAIGYFIGSKLSQNPDIHQELFRAFVISSLATFVVPFLVYALGSTLPKMYEGQFPPAGLFLFTLLAALIALMPAGIAYGLVSPLIIEALGRDGHHPGTVSGKVFAVSTIGSILGSFLTPIVFYPVVGTYLTFILIAFLVMLMAAAVIKTRKLLMVSIALALLVLGIALKPNPLAGENVVYASETPYQVIRLIDKGEQYELIFNEGLGIQSIQSKTGPWTGGYWDLQALLPFLHGGSNLETLLIGYAGGTIPRIWRETSASERIDSIDAVDIDPEVFEISRTFFDEDLYNVEPIAKDGRMHLLASKKLYDLILVDAYANELQIPFHVATFEFFELVKSRLHDDGMLVFNIAVSSETELGKRLIQTTKTVFPYVYLLQPIDTYNTQVIASSRVLDFENAHELYAALQIPQPEEFTVEEVKRDLSVTPFTDDKAPLELLTDLSLF